VFTPVFEFGTVPDCFTYGILVPLLKKLTSESSVPKSYKLIVISTTFSKIWGIHILEKCGHYELDDSQFGFVLCRGTNIAIYITRDVILYCVKQGSPICPCFLAGEGAFAAILQSILFDKCIDILPNVSWLLLYFWYENLITQIRWNNVLSNRIRVERGTRQESLSSPFLFNIYYHDIMVELTNTIGGIGIDTISYRISCYVDDVLLTCFTVTSLERLINVADRYISSHGMRFNSKKTYCIIYLINYFSLLKPWMVFRRHYVSTVIKYNVLRG